MQESDRKNKLNSDKIKKLEQNLTNVSFLILNFKMFSMEVLLTAPPTWFNF